MLFCSVQFYPVLFCPMLSRPRGCYSVFLSYSGLSFFVLFYTILSCLPNPTLSSTLLSDSILSYLTESYPILMILSKPILSLPILFYPMLSHPILSYSVHLLSYSILFYPVVFYPTSYFILSHSILFSILHPTRSHSIHVILSYNIRCYYTFFVPWLLGLHTCCWLVLVYPILFSNLLCYAILCLPTQYDFAFNPILIIISNSSYPILVFPILS